MLPQPWMQPEVGVEDDHASRCTSTAGCRCHCIRKPRYHCIRNAPCHSIRDASVAPRAQLVAEVEATLPSKVAQVGQLLAPRPTAPGTVARMQLLVPTLPMEVHEWGEPARVPARDISRAVDRLVVRVDHDGMPASTRCASPISDSVRLRYTLGTKLLFQQLFDDACAYFFRFAPAPHPPCPDRHRSQL